MPKDYHDPSPPSRFRGGESLHRPGSLGWAQACIDRGKALARELVQSPRPIGSFQQAKHRLAEMMIEVEQARSAFYSPASAQDEIGDARALAVHSSKAFASEIYQFCAGKVIQLHRGIGLTWEHDAASLQPRGEHCLRARIAALHPKQVARLSRLDAAA